MQAWQEADRTLWPSGPGKPSWKAQRNQTQYMRTHPRRPGHTLHITHMTLTTCLHTNHTWTALLSFVHTQNVFHTVPHFAMMNTLRHKSRPDHSNFPSDVWTASTDLDIHTPVHSCLQNTAYFEGWKHEPAISTYLLFLFSVISFTLSRCCHHFQPLLHPPT